MTFPATRLRRLRQSQALRQLVRETDLSADQLVYPLFVSPHVSERAPIETLPGIDHLSVQSAVAEAQDAYSRGIRTVLLFGLPRVKDDLGSEAWSDDGPAQQAVRAIKAALPDLTVFSDVCLCSFTSHGHCGVLRTTASGRPVIDNDETLELLSRIALSHVRAGADGVAPSDMMDGRVAAIRTLLDDEDFSDTVIMSYAAKFASAFYGPFRGAADCAPQHFDRSSYQMDPRNGDEALREAQLDVAEGADILMVKPALPYLDVISTIKQRLGMPVAAYNVSGEYAMVKAAAAAALIDERKVVLETLLAIRRAGADIIITYHAKDAAQWLN